MARADVQVANVTAAQRPGTKLMEIGYDVSCPVTNIVTVSLAVTSNGAPIAATALSGDVGAVAVGTGKSIVWNMADDWNGNVGELTFTVTADDGAGSASARWHGLRAGRDDGGHNG